MAAHGRNGRIFHMQAEEKQLKDIRSLLPEELETELAAMGEPKYRAKQIFKWLCRGVGSFGEMSDLPMALREKLEAASPLSLAI